MVKHLLLATALAVPALVSTPLLAQEKLPQSKLKLGVLTTQSGPGAAFGAETLGGINLALKKLDGKIGGVPVELVVGDDQGKPDIGKQIAERFLQKDKVNIITGTIFGQVILAAAPAAFAEKVPFFPTVAGPSDYAGAGCNRYFFSAGYQSDAPHEIMGKYLTSKNFKKVYVVVPNFPAGKDAVAGIKRFYKEPLAGETYTPLNQVDYSTEIADIQAKKPEAVYIFLPGALGINFIKQYKLAGLTKISPLMGPNFAFEEDILKAVGDAPLGALNSSHWSNDMATPENREFVAAFEKEFKRLPSGYAANAYDATMLLNAALAPLKGNFSNREAVAQAIENVKFKSIRGNFRFNKNHMPVQDWVLRAVVKDEQGRVTNRIVDRVATGHADAYAAACNMK
jgi:branched-chain amino acid transport system substrate-binding protein